MRARSLPVAAPFELRLVLHGHGWIDLAPHAWDEDSETWTTALHLDGRPHVVAVRQDGERLTLTTRSADGRPPADPRRAIARMVRLDLDLAPFWELCDGEPEFAWVRARGAGRLLRSAHAFEDLMKLLFTTNCSWAATKLMTSRLVAALGSAAGGGVKAFPLPEACARQDAAFWRDVVRVGYRAKAAMLLASAFADGALTDEHFSAQELDATTLRQRLLALEGFGPYAAGQALRLFGHHEDLALDSWCRATWTELRGKKRPPADTTIAREYRHFGSWQGLALWLDLTARWHTGVTG